MNRLTSSVIAASFMALPWLAWSEPVLANGHPPHPVVELKTAKGKILFEVLLDEAPLSGGDFLRYVDRGLYDDATFFRAVRPSNDGSPFKITVVQAGIADDSPPLPPVAHESTVQSGILHRNGVISLARGAPGTGGGASFFVCVGASPELDYGGHRNPDGLGFAAFGRVIRGMDVVRKIYRMPVRPDAASASMKGQILTKPVIIFSARRVKR